MADGAELQRIVDEAQEAGLTPSARSTALNKLALSNIEALVKSTCRTGDLPVGGEASEALAGVFLLAKAAVKGDQRHKFLQDLSELARDLVAAKLFLPEALGFLQATIQRLAMTRTEARQRLLAIDALLAGITPGNPGLQAFMTILSVLLPVLKADDRQRFIDAILGLPKKFRKDPLVPSVERYHATLKRAETALLHDTLTAPAFSSVISIHSHKGGVGKTTVGISLALALARDNKRVCLVDCDEQGPSLLFDLPMEATTQKDALFLSDWLCSDKTALPDGLIKPVADFDGMVHYIAGSFIGVDISNMDSYQATARTENPENVRDRLAHLVHVLLKDEGFDSVILDTSPGLLRLSLDVLMACMQLNGSRVFVMCPRPIDITQFCMEEDWILTLPGRAPADAIVVNHILAKGHSSSTVDVSDPQAIWKELSNWPQFQAYAKRYTMLNTTVILEELVKTTWALGSVVPVPESEALRHARTIRFRPGESLAQVLGKNDLVMKAAGKILEELEEQWEPRGETL